VGAQGIATLDFGAFPGTDHATVAVTGQAGIVAGSLVEAWLRPETTADHTADEHMVESIEVFAADIIAGTGFTIHGQCTFHTRQSAGFADLNPIEQENSPRLYGAWSVAWAWN
jgi:hypothetical protein